MSNNSVHLSRQSSSGPVRTSVRSGAVARLWLVLALLIALVMIVAWIDGGERALRPISEQISLASSPGAEAEN